MLSGFVDSYLYLNPMEVIEFEQEVAKIKVGNEKEQVMQIVTSWMEQGIEQGEQKATLKSVLRVLNRRVGSLGTDVQERLEALSVSQLEDLLDAALDFQGMDELIAWLDSNKWPQHSSVPQHLQNKASVS